MLGPNSTLKYNLPIEFRDYKLYRKDCQPGKWGVAILVKEDIPHSIINIKSNLEQISIKMLFRGKEISLTSLYLPNGIPINKNELEILYNQLSNNKMILGDMNAHHSLWGDKRSCPRGRKLVEFVSSKDLVVLNDGNPTFFSHVGRPSAIDISIVSPNYSWM